MTKSLNEVAALCKRAARGAGLSWGLSEEAARAARWLAGFSLPGPDALASLLTEHENIGFKALRAQTSFEDWQSESGSLCPLSAGTVLADCAQMLGLADGHELRMQGVLQPLLLLPFAALAAEALGRPVTLCWQDVKATCDGDALFVDAKTDALATARTDVTCRVASASGKARPRQSRYDDPPTVWKRLDRFAHRTYAPATAASRLRGAGEEG